MGQNISKSMVLAKCLVGTAMVAVALTGVAQAQSAAAPTPGLTNTFYGRFDGGVAVSTGARGIDAKNNVTPYTSTRMSNGIMGSRLGVRGVYQFDEPTLKAMYGIELGTNIFNGNAGGASAQSTQNCNAVSPTTAPTVTANSVVNPDNTVTTTTVVKAAPCNAPNVLFNRGYTVGLGSTDFGSIELGMMYAAPFWVILGADQSGYNYGLSDTSALFAVTKNDAMGRYLANPVSSVSNKSGTNTAVGAGVANTGLGAFYANSLRVRSPKISGVTGELFYSHGQNASGLNNLSKDGQTYAANVLYNDGPLFVGVGGMIYSQVNDVALSADSFSNWKTREQTSGTVGARYKIDDLTVGAAFSMLTVSNAGGYTAMGYGVSSAYDITKNNRVELSFGINSASKTAEVGAYGRNTGRTISEKVTNEDGTTTTKILGGTGDPQTISYAATYFYQIAPSTKYYLGYTANSNNSNANLGVMPFRGDTAATAWGSSPYSVATGMFFVF